MDTIGEAVLGLFGITSVISLACFIEGLYASTLKNRQELASLALRRETLTQQRNQEQQAAEVRAAAAEAKAEALMYTATEIQKALETQKAPSVVVQS